MYAGQISLVDRSSTAMDIEAEYTLLLSLEGIAGIKPEDLSPLLIWCFKSYLDIIIKYRYVVII